MSFVPKPGLTPDSGRRPEDKPPSNLYTGVFGNSKVLAEASSFEPLKDVEELASSIQHLCSAEDFNFETTVGFIVGSLLDFFGGSGVAIALERGSSVLCCASAGATAPEVGTALNTASGISGVCFRTSQSQYCHDARRDERVNYESCQALGILSILISPVLAGERTIGLVEVFSPEEFFFDKNDISALETIASVIARVHERNLASGLTTRSAQIPPVSDPVPAAMPKVLAAAASAAPAFAVPATEVMAAASPARAKSPEIVAAPSVPKASHPRSADLEVLPLAGFQVATDLPVPASAARTASIQNPKVALGITNRNKSLLIMLAATVVLAGGWIGTRTLLNQRFAFSSQSAAQTLPPSNANSTKAVDPAAVATPPVSVPAIKTAVEKVLPDTAVGATQTKAPAAQKTQVVDLLASDTQPRAISGRNDTQSESTLEAPSLGAVITGRPSANLVSSIAALSAAAPRLTRSSVVEPEVLIHKVAPVYPTIARSAHVDGEVLVRFTIAKDGSVKNAVIEKGHSMLRGAVLDAVQRWKYKPYKVDNEPREIQTLVSVKFR